MAHQEDFWLAKNHFGRDGIWPKIIRLVLFVFLLRGWMAKLLWKISANEELKVNLLLTTIHCQNLPSSSVDLRILLRAFGFCISYEMLPRASFLLTHVNVKTLANLVLLIYFSLLTVLKFKKIQCVCQLPYFGLNFKFWLMFV